MKTRFLTTVCALLTLAVLLGGCSAGAEKAPKKEVGIQLYSVRSLIGAFGNNQEDYKPVLKQLADMGYTSVEAASYKEGKIYGQTPEQFRKDVEEAGMKVLSTHCTINLTGVTLTNNDSDAYLLNVTGNSASHGWGTAGSNGAQVEFTADDQTLEGDIIVDSISTLELTLSGSSSFTGIINITENADGGTAVDDNAVVTVEEGSTWTLTGDCTITSLTNNGTIDFNGHTITLADGTVLGE